MSYCKQFTCSSDLQPSKLGLQTLSQGCSDDQVKKLEEVAGSIAQTNIALKKILALTYELLLITSINSCWSVLNFLRNSGTDFNEENNHSTNLVLLFVAVYKVL